MSNMHVNEEGERVKEKVRKSEREAPVGVCMLGLLDLFGSPTFLPFLYSVFLSSCSLFVFSVIGENYQ